MFSGPEVSFPTAHKSKTWMFSFIFSNWHEIPVFVPLSFFFLAPSKLNQIYENKNLTYKV